MSARSEFQAHMRRVHGRLIGWEVSRVRPGLIGKLAPITMATFYGKKAMTYAREHAYKLTLAAAGFGR